jgi:ferritin-like metal-binding protein YciE
MTPNDLEEQLTKYLTDAHAIEQQALVQMRSAPKLAGDAQIAQAFSEHLEETAEHEKIVTERLEARGTSASRIKDIAGAVTGKGFGVFAAAQPDTPGKLVVHAFSYEHMNWGAFFTAQPDTPVKLAAFAFAVEHLECGSYEMLRRIAERASDPDTVQMAEQILSEERAAGQRIRSLFPQALDAALEEQGVSTLL